MVDDISLMLKNTILTSSKKNNVKIKIYGRINVSDSLSNRNRRKEKNYPDLVHAPNMLVYHG